ncbi:hypothetical protein AX15_003001 [Amanita polypyramis BW_CC]|nr:hypothetical protein AX15_003001 [Amanita polypyramis BW_CC]
MDRHWSPSSDPESFRLSPESSVELSSVLPTQLHAMFWGRSMADEEKKWHDAQLPIPVESDDDIIEGFHFLEIDIKGFKFPRIWIRAEYIRIYDALEALLQNAFISLSGTSRRHYRPTRNRKPAIWYYRKTRYLFVEEGVYEVPDKFNDFEVFVWTLVDSDDAKDGVPENLVMRHTCHFVIYCTSPSRDRWSRLHKTTGQDVQEAISNLTISELQRLLRDSRSLAMDAVSHKICLISRKDRENMYSRAIVSPITSSIKSRLANRFRTLRGCSSGMLPRRKEPPNSFKWYNFPRASVKNNPRWYSSHIFPYNAILEAARQRALQERQSLNIPRGLPVGEYTDNGPSSIIFQFSIGKDHDIKPGAH